MKVLFVIAGLICVIPASVEATQQCISCTSDGCQKRFPKTVSCDEKCYKMLLRKESPDQDDPYVAKGCTSEVYFTDHHVPTNVTTQRRSLAHPCTISVFTVALETNAIPVHR